MVNRSIKPITYREYLDDYWSDLTTSPRGVEDRIHIREVEEGVFRHMASGVEVWESDYDDLEENEQDNYSFVGENTKEWQIWSWGTGGNHPYYTGTSFDNEEDAELYLYECKENDMYNGNCNVPRFLDTYEEAVTDMAEGLERSEEVIKRYLSIAEITARKAAEHRAKITREYEERKAIVEAEVQKEADSIIIDDEFKAGVKWAEEVRGQEKSQRMASAMKGLLSRNGKEKIESDFWQVIRILKSKI